jgi:hypothetical protein
LLRCGLAQAPGQVQRDSGKSSEGPGKGSGGFGAEPGQIQVRFKKVPEKVPVNVWEVLVQRQLRFNRVPEKLPEKVPGGFGTNSSQIQ